MATKPLPDADTLRKLLDYNPETGVLTWRQRPLCRFPNLRAATSWNAKYAGKPTGNHDGYRGYLWVRIEGRSYKSHRVAWLIVTGKWPSAMIDHINNDPADNRFCNLREASRSENSRNRKLNTDSVSGFKGVRWRAARRRWEATIRVEGKLHRLGRFDTAEEAHEAYCKAARELHGEFFNPGH